MKMAEENVEDKRKEYTKSYNAIVEEFGNSMRHYDQLYLDGKITVEQLEAAERFEWQQRSARMSLLGLVYLDKT